MRLSMDDIDSTIKRLEEEIKSAEMTEGVLEIMAQYSKEDKIMLAEKLKKEIENEPTAKWNLKFNNTFPTLNEKIGGFRAGDLIVVSAPTGEGKTLLCQTFTYHFQEQGVCWFSYEIPIRQLLERFGNNLPKFYLPRKMTSSTLGWIEERIIEAIAKYKIKIVMIDHLHYLIDLAKLKNPSIELGLIMRLLKKMAIKLDIAIVIIAHTGKINKTEELSLHNIRDSSFISQEADFVLMLSRERDDENVFGEQTRLSIQKNRRTGEVGKFNIILNQKTKCFEEVSKREE